MTGSRRRGWMCVVTVVLMLSTGCSSTPPSDVTTTDVDWRPTMLERNHQHTGNCCRFIPIQGEDK